MLPKGEGGPDVLSCCLAQAEEGGGGPDQPLWADSKPAVQEAAPKAGPPATACGATAPQWAGHHEADHRGHAPVAKVMAKCVPISNQQSRSARLL